MKMMDLLYGTERLLVDILANGHFRITFEDRTQCILKHRLDDLQEVYWYFENEADPERADAIGRLIEDHIY